MCYDMSILIVKTNICQMSEMTYFFKYFFLISNSYCDGLNETSC